MAKITHAMMLAAMDKLCERLGGAAKYVTGSDMNAILTAALDAAPSPPAPGGVPIRIAVGLQTIIEVGTERDWGIYKLRSDEPDETAWSYLNSIGYSIRAAIITATLSPPVVAEIEGSVQPAGGE